MAGGYGEFGLGHSVAAGGAAGAGAYGELDGRVARDASQRLRSDANGAVQAQGAGAAAGQVDAAASAAGSASALPGRVQASGWAGGQADAQAEVSH